MVLKENPTVNITIIGHTDSDGNETENQKLSEKRAEAVALYFITNYEISKSRLKTKGYGETLPIVDNDSEENKQQNRRVEFVVIK